MDSPANKTSMSFLEFLNTDMNHKVIYSIVLTALSNEHEYRSYKVRIKSISDVSFISQIRFNFNWGVFYVQIMPRAQNAHAHVNAGFLFKLDGAGKVLEKPNIIIGGIKDDFVRYEKKFNN